MQGIAPDWQDFLGIIVLLVINSTISFIEENNAGNAAAALMARLAPKTKVGYPNMTISGSQLDGAGSLWDHVLTALLLEVSHTSQYKGVAAVCPYAYQWWKAGIMLRVVSVILSKVALHNVVAGFARWKVVRKRRCYFSAW